MKRLTLVFLFLIGLIGQVSAVGCTGTGNCYWVGGTGNWSDTTKWATTDGGATTGGLPSATDNVFFTALSNATAYTVTADTTATCLNMSWALPSGSGVPTFSSVTQNIWIYGNLTTVSGMIWPSGGSTFFRSSTTGKTVTTNGVSIDNGINFFDAGGGWTLLDALTVPATKTITVSNGTLNTNAQTVTTGFFVSTSGTRTLTLDGSTINITGTSGTPYSISTGGTLIFSAANTVFNFTGGAAGVALTATIGGISYNSATINMTGPGGAGLPGIWSINWNSGTVFGNFNYLSSTNKTDALVLTGANNITITANGLLSFVGNSTVNRAFVYGGTLGTQRGFIVSGTTVPTLTNVDFRDFILSGITGTGTSLGDCLGNSGITFDASTTQTLVSTGTINWSTAANWTSRVPLPQDDVVVDYSGGSALSLSADMPRLGRNINFTGFTKTVLFTSVANTLFGNIVLGSGGNFSGTLGLTLAGRSASHTITSNGKTFPMTVTVSAFTPGTYTLLDALSITGTLAVSVGTFDSGAFNVDATNHSLSAGSVTKSAAASTWSITRTTTGSAWSVSASADLTNFFANLNLTTNNTAAITFAGGSKTYGNFYWSGVAATGSVTFTGTNTFNDFKIDGTTARTVTLPASTTTTVSTFTKSNDTAGQLTSLISSTGGTPATLAKASGTTILNYMSIKDITATGGNWYACNSTNVSGNTGWNISAGACPLGDSSRLMMMGVSN